MKYPGYSGRSRVAMVAAACLVAVPATAWQPSSSDGSVPPHPVRVVWGDTHVHSTLSHDAFVYGTRLTADEAYRFAKGETVRSNGGESVRLDRPLDFLMVADHAENLGVMPGLETGDDRIPETESRRLASTVLAGLRAIPDLLHAASVADFDRWRSAYDAAKPVGGADYEVDPDFARSVWHEIVDTAERHNEPGVFTTFAGFEWSGRARAGPGTHRNVLFADGPERTRRVVPFSRLMSDDPEDLWAYLRDYEERLGGRAIAIPHNGNLTGGEMFALGDFFGEPLTSVYARARARWEPIVEVTQIKGDGEVHPMLSPDDEFADFEPWFAYRRDAEPGAAERNASSYARSALALGLELDARLGANPFKFGMIGSTDAHTALATADDDNYQGKMAITESGPHRVRSQWQYAASGYAGVWARENTRGSIFEALARREVYATTGPRITVRFFAGWDFSTEDAEVADLAKVGYAKGVPMGADLAPPPAPGRSPGFLVGVWKDPDGANLDRVQIVKGHRDGTGDLREKIYDVALSDDRRPDGSGRVPPLGSTVDLETATYRNSIGAEGFTFVWDDPDFDPREPAFYYVRVIEIPTPRWTAYDAVRYRLTDLPDAVPMVTRERVYSSPVWYSPPSP